MTKRKTEPDAWALVEESKRLYGAAKTPEDRARAIASRRSQLRLAEKQHGASERLLGELDELIAAAKASHSLNVRRQSNGHGGRDNPIRTQLRSLGAYRAVLSVRLDAAGPAANASVEVVVDFLGLESMTYRYSRAKVRDMYPFTDELWAHADRVEIDVVGMQGEAVARLVADGVVIAEGQFDFGSRKGADSGGSWPIEPEEPKGGGS